MSGGGDRAPNASSREMTAGLDKEAMLARIPLGRLGRPEDVSRAVLFLLGEGGDYVTGQVIGVNGGLA